MVTATLTKDAVLDVPTSVPTHFAPKATCACGQKATVVHLYGEVGSQPWAANPWCAKHAAEPQCYPVLATLPHPQTGR